MAADFTTCPKCRHARRPAETSDPGICPACGLVFAKWLARGQFVPSRRRAEPEVVEDESESLRSVLVARLTEVPARVDPIFFWGRLTVLALFAIWSWRLVRYDFRTGAIGESFMHNILLPIHEAGHILFMPFGEFMTVAGGSLFQVLLPLIAGIVILVRNRDPFGAGLGLWWAGTGLVDVAPYIYDAANPQLMLLTGTTGEDGPHDWIYLLGQFGKVARSPAYGSAVHSFGALVMLLGLAWSAFILWRQKAHMVSDGTGEMPL